MPDIIQLHALFHYPPSRPNSDRDGNPKDCIIGNTRRWRISSQCLKGCWRCSPIFIESFGGRFGTGNLGVRTRETPYLIFLALLEGGYGESDAEAWARIIGSVFGKMVEPEKSKKLKPAKKGKNAEAIEDEESGEAETQGDEKIVLRNEAAVFISPEENDALYNRFLPALIKEKRRPPAIKGDKALENEAKKIRHEIMQQTSKAVDVSFWGRFFSNEKIYCVEAGVQVAHAFTTTPAEWISDTIGLRDDVKDRSEAAENRGGAAIFEQGLISGIFYQHLSMNNAQIEKNLKDPELASRARKVLTEMFFTATPNGKKNSSAHGTTAFYGRCERGSVQPRNLDLAYMNAITGSNAGVESVQRLRKEAAGINQVFGPRYDEMKEFCLLDENPGSLKDLIDLAGR